MVNGDIWNVSVAQKPEDSFAIHRRLSRTNCESGRKVTTSRPNHNVIGKLWCRTTPEIRVPNKEGGMMDARSAGSRLAPTEETTTGRTTGGAIAQTTGETTDQTTDDTNTTTSGDVKTWPYSLRMKCWAIISVSLVRRIRICETSAHQNPFCLGQTC